MNLKDFYDSKYFPTENEIVEVLEEADFSEYGREKFNLGVTMLKIIYEIKPPASPVPL